MTVEIPLANAATDYAVDALTGFVQSKLPTRAMSLQSSVADCADEVGTTWSRNSLDSNTPLPNRLADFALGPGLACQRLFRAVASATGEPLPQPEQLSKELARHSRAMLFDDVLMVVRKALVLSPRG